MRSKIPIFVASIFILALLGFNDAFAQNSPCDESGLEIENAIGHLNSWDDIYKSFKTYRTCDDGSIAEAYSDIVVRTLAGHWEQLDRLAKLSAEDKEFHNFVMLHIDATVDDNDLKKILINCKQCPKSFEKICSEIKNAAQNALKEM